MIGQIQSGTLKQSRHDLQDVLIMMSLVQPFSIGAMLIASLCHSGKPTTGQTSP